MCGIAGIICDTPSDAAPSLLVRMTQLLHHRGPDAGGAVVWGMGGTPVVGRRLGLPGDPIHWSGARAAVGIGARRLAILDRSERGNQPMSARDGHACIVHNGEIYNHAELRDDLTHRGIRFEGTSDTEVALAAYRAWGPDCFRRFEGMWAIAIVDWVAGRLVLSRDQLGIKPLYLAAFDGGHAFASEIKSLLTLPGVSRDVNEARLRDFLVSGIIDHTNETLYESVWAMQPGTWLEIDLRPASSTEKLGKSTGFFPPDGAASEAEVSPAQWLRNIDCSVSKHLRSDVPVGSCLSGGIDSSTVVAAIHSLAKDQCPPTWTQFTFSAVLPGDLLDESRYLDAFHANRHGLREHRVSPDPVKLVEELDRIVWHQDEPFGSPSILMQWEVMRLAREYGVTVLLDGQGADELFCGYPGYFPPYIADAFRHFHWVRAAREFLSAPLKQHYTAGSLLAHVAGHVIPRPAQTALRAWRDRRRCGWLSEELLRVNDVIIAPYQERIPRVPRRSPTFAHGFAAFCWDMLLSSSLPSLLHFEDRNSMAFSIEARVPFLDNRLILPAMLMSPALKLSGGWTKFILRKAIAGRVPDAIRLRTDKVGFAAPTTAWLRGPMKSWWTDIFESKSFAQRGCFEPAGVRQLAERFHAGDDRPALPIWRMAIAETWARRMLDRRD